MIATMDAGKSKYQEAIETLREQGHRLTPQRLLVLSIVADGAAHMGVDDVFKLAKDATRIWTSPRCTGPSICTRTLGL